MRFLFLLIIIVNVAVFALGRGYFGTPPYNQGQQAGQPAEINPQAIRLGAPGIPEQ